MIKPSYYDKFNCIADKCDFTCCQEWKIGVDDDTINKWNKKKATEYYGEHVSNSKSDCMLSDHIVNVNDNNIIKLCDNRLCPFLNKNRLCNIVLKEGEEFISDTCHTFPREYREFNDHTEHTLMLCCPHVIDLLNHELKFETVKDDTVNLQGYFELRQNIIDYLQKEDNIILSRKMIIAYFILLECYEKESYDKDVFLLISELEKTIDDMEHNESDTLNECNELMLDLIDNYLNEGVYEKYLEPLSVEANDLEDKISESDFLPDDEKDVYDRFNKVWLEFEPLLKKCFSQEIYGELIIEEDDIEGMLVKYQWIAMEYSLVRHFCYLHFRKNNELSYNNLKVYMVVAFRIMGFDDEDIFEYMENSFESIIWEWGYMALLLI